MDGEDKNREEQEDVCKSVRKTSDITSETNEGDREYIEGDKRTCSSRSVSDQDEYVNEDTKFDFEGGRQHFPSQENERTDTELVLEGGDQHCPGQEHNRIGPSQRFRQEEQLSYHNKAAKLSSNSRAPDGGWSWMVLIGSFIAMVPVTSLVHCFSILFSGFLLDLKTSSTTIAWIFNTEVLLYHGMGPLLRPLTKEFGWRRISYLGVFLVTSSVLLSAFAPSAEYLFFSYSLLFGIGGGLAAGICYIIIPIYFDRRLGLANAVLHAGPCIGQIACAPFIRYLLDEYGFKGGLLVFGGFVMNAFVGVSLFHPPKWHMQTYQLNCKYPHQEDHMLLRTGNQCTNISEETSHACPVIHSQNTKGRNSEKKIDDPAYQSDPQLENIHQQMTEGSRYYVPVSDVPSEAFTPQYNYLSSSPSKEPKSSVLPLVKRLCAILVRVMKGTISDMGILRFHRAKVIVVSAVLANCAHYSLMLLMPFVVQAKGHSLKDAASVISVMGIFNVVTRLTVSPLSDWRRFNLRVCLMLGYALNTAALLVFSFLTELKWVLMTAGMLGVAMGIFVTLPSLLVVKYMGVENHPATLGVGNIGIGLFFLPIGFLVGYIRDVTQSYTVSLWVVASMHVMSFVCWVFMPTAEAQDKKVKQKAATQEAF